MGMDHAECIRMIDACRTAGVPLWVGYYRRALPRFLKVRDLIERGAIGSVRCVVIRSYQRVPPHEDFIGGAPWRVDARRSGGGFFFEGACHTLDFMDFLFGPVESVRAHASNQARAYAPEDLVTASLRFASGVQASGAWCYACDVDDEYNEVVGSGGRLRFSTSKAVPIQLRRGDVVEAIAVDDPPHVHQPLIQSIVDELNGSGRAPSTGESAARTSWVMDEILKDFRAAS
jgi:predicted dehydrogenase